MTNERDVFGEWIESYSPIIEFALGIHNSLVDHEVELKIATGMHKVPLEDYWKAFKFKGLEVGYRAFSIYDHQLQDICLDLRFLFSGNGQFDLTQFVKYKQALIVKVTNSNLVIPVCEILRFDTKSAVIGPLSEESWELFKDQHSL